MDNVDITDVVHFLINNGEDFRIMYKGKEFHNIGDKLYCDGEMVNGVSDSRLDAIKNIIDQKNDSDLWAAVWAERCPHIPLETYLAYHNATDALLHLGGENLHDVLTVAGISKEDFEMVCEIETNAYSSMMLSGLPPRGESYE